MKRCLVIFSLLAYCCIQANAQTIPPSDQRDSLFSKSPPPILATDNRQAEEIEMYASRFIPRKASLYAAILPGAGQFYNKKYWKIPLVYGGFIALGLVIDFYDDNYQLYRRELFKKIENGNYIAIANASETQLRTVVDRNRRERDFYMIMTGFFYLLQIADAHIDAHLKEFDLNPKLQISLEPMVEQIQSYSCNAGLSIKLKF